MPLMVDDNSMMDHMDDLFGDDDNEGLHAALAATLDSDMLRIRVEESHRLGCCQKLAWSKTGSVAHISPSGRSISIRAFARDKKTGKWSLSKQDKTPIITPDDAVFVHVEWSTTGTELIVTDAFGRLNVYAMAFALNRLMPHMLSYNIPHDDLSAVIGLHWLPPNQGPTRVPIVSAATKENDRWSIGMTAYQHQVVAHPFDNKSAFLCITRNNRLKLISQQQVQPWSEAVLELGEPSSSNGIITHASFGDVQGQIFLATYDVSKSLRFYRVNITWNPAQGDQQHGQPATVSPTLRITHIQLLDRVLPQHSNGAELSQILIQPPPTVGAEKGHVSVTALFTCLPDDQHMGPQADGRGSVIARWELRRSEVGLHDVFKTLKPGTEVVMASKPREALYRQDDVHTQKIYLSLVDNLYHNVLACLSSDGTVDFRNRDAMDIIMTDGDTNRVSSLQQAGFNFMHSECTDFALSPSGCVAVIAKQDGTIQLHTAEYIHGWDNAKSDHFLPQAAIVALARESGILLCHSLGNDDILSLLPIDSDVGLRRRFITEVLRFVSKNTDFSHDDASKDKAKVMKDSSLFRILGMQLLLGYKDDPAKRDIPGKFAWTMVNLRSCCSNMAATMSMINAQSSPDVVISLRGLAKYYVDLVHHLISDLTTLHHFITSAPQTSLPIKDRILLHLSKTHSPALHILLHSASRNLLRFLNEIAKHYFQRCIASKPSCTKLSQRSSLSELENLVQHTLAVKIPVFDQLLQELDSGVRKAYAEAPNGAGEPRGRSLAEGAMLAEAEVPDVLVPALEGLLYEGGLVAKFRERVDGVKVFLSETRWLGISGGEDEEEGEGDGDVGKGVDVVRKLDMRAGCKIRTCRRCGSVVEDLWEERGLMPWIMASQRACVCAGAWIA